MLNKVTGSIDWLRQRCRWAGVQGPRRAPHAMSDPESLAALEGLHLIDLQWQDDQLWLVLARHGDTPAALARPALIDATGTVAAPDSILRIVEPGWVYEQYGFPVPAPSGHLSLHVSAGSGCRGIDLPLPASCYPASSAA